MAGNDWINSYLEAILDVGPGLDEKKPSLLLRERGRFSPTRYFVEEVVSGFDETDLYRAWVRVCSGDEESAREEYEVGEYVLEDLELGSAKETGCLITSRIAIAAHWAHDRFGEDDHMLEGELAQRKAKRHLERERGRREAVADMSEDLSEGEKGDAVGDLSAHGDSIRNRLSRINSVDAMEAWANQQKGKKLYIVLIRHGLNFSSLIIECACEEDYKAFSCLHGLIRGENMELGRDSDTGGQVKYVVELARALGSMPGVYRVDLFTRQVSAPDVDWSYGEPTEMLTLRNSEDFLDEMGESSGAYIVRIPFGPKDKYVPKELLQEIEQQWRLYDGFDPILERKLRARIKRNVSCYGKFMPRMAILVSESQLVAVYVNLGYLEFDVLPIKRNAHGTKYKMIIPPGMEFHHIIPQDGDMDGEIEGNDDHPTPDPPIWAEIMRFFTNPRKPMILALARPDPKKNITTLVKAFGECRQLRELANLTLIMGNRDGIDEMSSTNASVLLSVLKLIDKYDLYGQVAYPKHHKQSDVPDIYRLAAKTKGVFINPAFIEPFGLTLIEAAAHGLPIVATKNGGPVDIHRVLDNGLLVDPHDQQSIAGALLKLVAEKHLWAKCRQNGLKNIHLFSWPEHCKTYLSRIAGCKSRHPQWQKSDDGADTSDTDSPGDSLRDIQDLSLNLKFSLDGEKTGGSGNDNPLDSEGNATDKKSKIENAVLSWSKGVVKDTRKAVDQNSSSGKFPSLRRRKQIFVIAVDFDTISSLAEATRKIFEAVEKERTEGSIGFILSTSLTISEIHSFLASGGFSPSDFDAFICNSGSDLYYSTPNPEDGPFVVDFYYHSHIEYRWGGEGLRKTLVRWASSVSDKAENEEQIVTAAEQLSTDYCYAFTVKKPGLVPPVKELQKVLRIRALRCHVIYCQNGTRLNVIPVLASRSQALRYLYVRWGVELANMVVFAGECGDTDYEGLLGGLHKSVVLKGVCSSASNQLHANRSYPLTDVIPSESPNIVQAPEESSVSACLSHGKRLISILMILNALEACLWVLSSYCIPSLNKRTQSCMYLWLGLHEPVNANLMVEGPLLKEERLDDTSGIGTVAKN
ncbi:hypothetical protein POTOM_024931 [Populus tomentosa]|uniref:sucrose-phosphate synthase n=1 Tax=Populus tomentosa TaxID=118781 RepID=A0A8X7ZKA3_POPTO|nr:hypothetical protein POTOM_024931 [Populus tomentosa]